VEKCYRRESSAADKDATRREIVREQSQQKEKRGGKGQTLS